MPCEPDLEENEMQLQDLKKASQRKIDTCKMGCKGRVLEVLRISGSAGEFCADVHGVGNMHLAATALQRTVPHMVWGTCTSIRKQNTKL